MNPDLTQIPGAPALLLPLLTGLATALLLLGLPLLVLELRRLRREGRLDRSRVQGMLTSAFCLLPASVVELMFGAALVALYFGAASLAPWSIPSTWLSLLLCFLLVDFLYYVEHRLAHEVNALWALYHSVHHSANHFDQSIGLRISFADFFVSPLIYLPLVLIGFHPLLVALCLGLVLAWQQWIHTELVGRLPWLDPWLNTPSNHRVHHGRNPEYIDRNYGGVLMIWDRLLGTYQPESAAVDYGLVEPLQRRDPWSVHFHVLARLLQQLRASGNFTAAWRLLWARPSAEPPACPASGRRP